jgi:uncharacterized protein (DUF1800 family)
MWLLVSGSALAQPQVVWQIGIDDDPFQTGGLGYDPKREFSSENWINDLPPGKVTRLPGDPLYNATNNPTADDDFYEAGIYPAGFNGLKDVLVVPNAEPDSAWESSLTNHDLTNRVHFILTSLQAGPLSRLRLSFEFDWGGMWTNPPVDMRGEGFGVHDIEVRFKNSAATTTLLATRVDRNRRFTLDFNASEVQAQAGPNTIEFVRTGPTATNIYIWIEFDYVKFEANTNALVDADGDGLPKWWEEENHLSDSNPLDAASDNDHDGLTALQEYNQGVRSTDPNRADTDGDGLSDGRERALGTNPLAWDTDGDGLSDGEEANNSPMSSPLLADSDGDGAPDSLERRLGTNPLDPHSTPTVFRGGVGIHFLSQADLDGTLGTIEATGIVPQTRWNETVPLNQWTRPAGSTADIANPVAGKLVRSDGMVLTNLTLNWKSDATDASKNKGSSDRKLMNGFLRADSTNLVSVTLSNIPFAHYDLYALVGGTSAGQRGCVRLGTNAANDRYFMTTTTGLETNFIEIKAGLTNYQRANFVRYTNLTASVAVLTLTNCAGPGVGLQALQIIDLDLDSDGSGIPDWYEMKYGLEPGTAALAAADSDGDGLSNLQEYQLGTDPHKADTDGDGLSDAQEWVLGTNPLSADTDGDGLSDGAEVNGLFHTNPKLADSDGDGVSDFNEIALGTDPTANPTNNTHWATTLPVFRSSPSRWDWTFNDVQLVWNHKTGGMARNIWNEDQLVSFQVDNTASGLTFDMELRYVFGSLSYRFESYYSGGFAYPNTPGVDIVSAEYEIIVADLQQQLGFSGYGLADISDRLRFQLSAQRGTGNSWNVNFEIRNMTSNAVVVTKTFTNCTAAPSIDNGSATWTDTTGMTNLPSIFVHQGVQLFFSPIPLASLPAFANFKDSDKDGMPDVWEDAHGFNKFSAADATQDADGDGVNNRDEYLAGTDPRNPDSDYDGIPDGLELLYGSNPLDAASKPEFAGANWPKGQDLDGNGLPDAWEIRYRAFNLPPDGDADGDGASNALEAKWGTDPFDPNSKPGIFLTRQTNDAVLAWSFQSGKDQRLFASTNLTVWQQLTDAPWLANGVASLRLTNHFLSVPREFYRVTTDDKDTDGDGVPDWAEAVLGSDPTRANSLHAPMPILNSTGGVIGTVSGDYAAFVEQVRGGLASVGKGKVTRAQAARLLQQATFGPVPHELDRVQELGFIGWINDQISNQPPTFHRDYIEQIYADYNSGHTDHSYIANEVEGMPDGNNCTTSFARAVIGSPDQLRQRVAFALSQILVASRRESGLQLKPRGMMDFYDIFVRNAFGNYYDALRQVTFHPIMGHYLSHIGNEKARPDINEYPDENFAREVMQLFTIGLWELNLDGTRKRDGMGQPIPTYNNLQITEFARVFTGFWFGGQGWAAGGVNDDDFAVPMQMWAEKHDYGSKTLLRGYVMPARAVTVDNGVRDVEDALRNLFEHPNTPPFICRQLIQFLVTSNPSTNYVARIAAKFVNNGAGIRGDLGAVVRAILMDEEARDARWFLGAPEFGRLKDPLQRAMGIARVGKLANYTNLVWLPAGVFYQSAWQEPTFSPSVFNFYRPSYQPPGLLTQTGLVGPAFQITDSYSVISFPNLLWEFTEQGLVLTGRYSFPPDYTDLLPLASNAPALVDEVNLLFCGGSMSYQTRDNILNTLLRFPAYDALLRCRLAIYLAAACPEGAVQR